MAQITWVGTQESMAEQPTTVLPFEIPQGLLFTAEMGTVASGLSFYPEKTVHGGF